MISRMTLDFYVVELIARLYQGGLKIMKEYEIEEVDGKTTELANQMTRFEELLVSYGLPSENVIAPIDERETIMSALPSFLAKMAPEEKERQPIYQSL